MTANWIVRLALIMLLRKITESREGIGSTCVLSEFKQEKVDQFLENPLAYRRERILPKNRPTDIIFDHLEKD